MFASTHPQEFPPAILSRLQRYDVRRLTVPEIEGKLTRILEADGRAAEPGAVNLIARLAAGGMRDAESMLDQLLASGGDRLDESRVRDLLGLADAESVDGFLRAIVTGDAAAGISILDGLENRGRDARVFLDQLVDAVRAALVAGLSGKASDGPPPARLAAAARRLAAIDPSRAGIGGLRLQLELALFSDAAEGAPAVVARVTSPAVTESAPPVVPRARPSEKATEPAKATEPVKATETAAPAPPPAAARPARKSADAPVAETAATETAATPGDGASVATPSGPPGDDLAILLAGWPELVSSARPATKAVISECRPLSVDDNVVVLGFPEAKAFLKEVAERKRPDIEAAVGQLLGRSVAVRCIATNIDVVPIPSDSDAAFVLAEAKRIFADDLVDVGEVS
jgi:DNA polymerase-3 subunit gamma/tau